MLFIWLESDKNSAKTDVRNEDGSLVQITNMFRAHFKQGWIQVLKLCNQDLRQVLPLQGQNAITAIPGSNPGGKRARLP